MVGVLLGVRHSLVRLDLNRVTMIGLLCAVMWHEADCKNGLMFAYLPSYFGTLLIPILTLRIIAGRPAEFCVEVWKFKPSHMQDCVRY